MKIKNQPYRSIWVKDSDQSIVQIIDQRHLPHELVIKDLKHLDDFAVAIRDMLVRGAPLIGVTAAYGMCAAIRDADVASDLNGAVQSAYQYLLGTRPTAVNLRWALDRQVAAISSVSTREEMLEKAFMTANQMADADVETCRQIGMHGLALIERLSEEKNGEPVNILTHCNAGWLATVDYGTATAPIYLAHDAGIPLHVWVDETRPRNQGSNITAYELGQHGIPHSVIVDNAGGHLMQHGKVDLCITGTDRTTASGDVCNKIGTYLKALAAFDNDIPFYVALPSSTIDWTIDNGIHEIQIEERSEDEVKYVKGLLDGRQVDVLITPPDTRASNYSFDVTPARLVTGLITELGVCQANKDDISTLFNRNNI